MSMYSTVNVSGQHGRLSVCVCLSQFFLFFFFSYWFSLHFTSLLLVIRKRIRFFDKTEWKPKNQKRERASEREKDRQLENNNRNNYDFVGFWTKRKSLFAFRRTNMMNGRRAKLRLCSISIEFTHQIRANNGKGEKLSQVDTFQRHKSTTKI